MYPTVLDKIATQTVVSSHVVDKIIQMIAHTSIKTITKTWHKKLKEIYYMYVQTISMTFVHDFLHQKQNFINLQVCHIDRPS